MSLKSASMASQGIKYAGEDFPGWKFNMEMLLKERGLWTVVEQGVEAEAKRYMMKKKLKGDDMEAAMIVASEMNEKALAKIVLHVDERYQAVEKNTAEVQMLLRDKVSSMKLQGAEFLTLERVRRHLLWVD